MLKTLKGEYPTQNQDGFGAFIPVQSYRYYNSDGSYNLYQGYYKQKNSFFALILFHVLLV